MATYALISCTKRKESRPCPAPLLYRRSTLFAATWDYAVSQGQVPLIVSAEHGLITDMEQVYAPYELSVKEMTPTERGRWGSRVRLSLKQVLLSQNDDLVSYLGSVYADAIGFGMVPVRGKMWNVAEPLKGKRVGERVQWLQQNIERG